MAEKSIERGWYSLGTEVRANGTSRTGDGSDPIITIDTGVTGGRKGER